MTKHITLIACCGEKLARVSAAHELYRSPLFRKSLTYAGTLGHEIRIISAAYGLIKSAQKLAPYDCPMSRLSAEDRGRWNRRIASELDICADGDTMRVTLLAGQSYAGWVPLVADWCEVEQPLAGLQIGQRLAWLNERLCAEASA